MYNCSVSDIEKDNIVGIFAIIPTGSAGDYWLESKSRKQDIPISE